MVKLSVVFISFIALACASPHPRDALHVHERRDSVPNGFAHAGPAPDDHVLNLRLALVQNNIDGLHQKLYDVSKPKSASYGKHLSKAEVEALVAPSAETDTAVKNWLSANNIAYNTISPAGDWLGINMTVQQANTLFGAEFSNFKNQATGKQSVRTLSYSIPASLKGHIDFIHPTVAFPAKPLGGPKVVGKAKSQPKFSNVTANAAPASCNDQFTPSCAQELYGIPTTAATQSSNQLAVSGFIGQYASLSDLAVCSFILLAEWQASDLGLQLFLENLRPDLVGTTFSVELIDGGINNQNSPGDEADLDTQYTVSIASKVPTIFISVGSNNPDGISGFLDIVNYLETLNPVPNVLSTSYSFNEPELPFSIANSLCNAYAQLGARGTSILFSSGDGGVSGGQSGGCTEFVPTFPSTCPFITSIGATQNVNPEVSASFSSGGFSTLFAIPDYQSAAVESYLAGIGSQYAGLFNASGRAFPDVSAAGVNYIIAWMDEFWLVDGTSCSTPLTASIVSLLNDELISAGRAPLGFLNPLLYESPSAFTDITSGTNPGCNTNGFSAGAGWDPVTGVGSPIFSELRSVIGL
ncbi:hypothetical protein EWM64_g1103 [Hericium alpestre]|uniref:Peptidase S53 domain-containing protein n=1 Tax=Hericium alpestre TaxID=135208 RepID=A0A4Z0AAD2_9AGAM|nr:hypothetical protein EWM64_g1103 [Hericium alpestre]